MPPSTPHRRRGFTGRDPEEKHRVSTPLELFYDLTVVIAFGVASDELAHFVAEGHAWAGIVGFAFACFAVIWAWLNYSWFASAYDTDDWFFRLATMVQMVGVIVLALGLPQMFGSIDHGDTLKNGVMVLGYVIMRVSQLTLWWQVSRHDPERAPAARTYITAIGIAQIGWVILALVGLPVAETFALMSICFAIELVGPYLAERKASTPWHAHHIAERYGLMVIITLGEVLIGTVAALNALVHGEAGWSLDAGLLALAGVGLAFGCWWVYFAIRWADALDRRRGRGFLFGWGHMLVFAPLAAMGSGLHVAAYKLGGETEITDVSVVLSVAIPVAIFTAVIYGLYSLLLSEQDPFHVLLLLGTAVLLVASVVLAGVGVSMVVCLLVVMLAPVVTVVGYETVGHRHMAEAIERIG
ncbi:MAG: low temperature requirement protein A [Solirubrobacterales bacterium]|nr:low temperature requirement protein A [Solirubrobacterales bacterium]